MKNEIGVMQGLSLDGPTLRNVADFGLKVCQVSCWESSLLGDARADELRAESEQTGITITSLWAGWPGPAVWDFIDGPRTLGLVPRRYRKARVDALKRAARFAHRAGLPAIATHLGFIPENPSDPLFGDVVDAVRDIAVLLEKLGMEFWFETGQETPVTMLRLLRQVGTGNLGVNFDPANLILYGKANPIDALDVLGPHVKSIHAKDGEYPTDPMKLGREVKVGSGQVRFPRLVRGLADLGYTGAYIIEREISGEQQRKDIAETVEYLGRIIGQLNGGSGEPRNGSATESA